MRAFELPCGSPLCVKFGDGDYVECLSGNMDGGYLKCDVPDTPATPVQAIYLIPALSVLNFVNERWQLEEQL